MTVLLKAKVTHDGERLVTQGRWARIMAELGSEEPLLLELPYEIEVTACAALGGKTIVTTIITREFKRS